MQRLYDFTPGQVALIHNRTLVSIWAKWEKVGQHQRTWYLVSNLDTRIPVLDLVSEDFLSIFEDETNGSRRIQLHELETHDSDAPFWGAAVLDKQDPYADYGGAYAVATLFNEEGTPVEKYSLGLAGSGYPWWLKTLTEDVVVGNAWKFYGENASRLSQDEYDEQWNAHLQTLPTLLSLSE